MEFSLKKGPNYKKVKNFISIFDTQVINIADEAMKEVAEEFAEHVRKVIYKQSYRWKPLSEAYLERKKALKLDTRILIATHEYIESIKSIPRKRDKKIVTWSVGPGHHNAVHKGSGLKFHTLARYLEFGNRKIPARPHWRPAWSAFIRKKNLVARDIIKKSMKRR